MRLNNDDEREPRNPIDASPIEAIRNSFNASIIEAIGNSLDASVLEAVRNRLAHAEVIRENLNDEVRLEMVHDAELLKRLERLKYFSRTNPSLPRRADESREPSKETPAPPEYAPPQRGF